MTENLPNLNLISIQKFAPFMRKINSDGTDRTGAIKLSDKCIDGYENTFKELQQCENGENLISLENLHNETVEQFLDTIDDHLNYDFSKWYGQLGQAGIHEKEILRQIPEYNAAINITGTDKNNDPLFPTRGMRMGHIWSKKAYRSILKRLSLPEVQDSIAFLKLTDCAKALLAIDKKLRGKTREYELLHKLREDRREYSQGVILIFCHSRFEKLLHKKGKHLKIAELVVEKLRTDHEIHLMEEFSTDDLNHTEYNKLLSNLSEETIPESKLDFWRGKAKGVMQEFQTAFKQFSVIDSWTELEQSEFKLTLAVERFRYTLLDLTRTVIISDYPELWEEYISTPTFQTGLDLIDDFWENKFYIERSFTFRRDTASLRDLQVLLSLGVTKPYATRIEQLGLTPLFKEICDWDTRSRDICLQEAIPYSHLEKFRVIREHSAVLYSILFHVDRSPDIKELLEELRNL